jgi:hypothetical protein
MTNPKSQADGFKRQVVFRISAADWPLIEQAAREHGSIQAALVAAVHTLGASPPRAAGHAQHEQGEAEITAREAARILGLKVDTVSAYIRSGRLPGRYKDTLGSMGWVSTQAAVAAYQQRVQVHR